jgi:hypothetical protein
VWRSADRVDERGLRLQEIALGLDQLSRIAEVLHHVVLGLRLEREQPLVDCRPQCGLAVRQVDREPVRLVDDADRLPVGFDALLGDGMDVDERSAGDDEPVDVTQGVHDALTLDSSE